MASFFSSYSLPRPLSKLYSDTKHVGDVVSEPEKSDELPELSALHRKFRIQKDRLIAWGLEWSDSAASQGDIEESVARAGLTETVTSVLNTIKDIYEEAERLQTSGTSTKSAGSSTFKEKEVSRPMLDPALAASERARYEALAKDLSDSIDILYDLSRTRRVIIKGSAAAASQSLKAPTYIPSGHPNPSETTLISPPNISFRTGLPPKLDLSSLILPDEEPPPYDSIEGRSSTRVIAQYLQTNSSTNPWKTDGSKIVEKPVMIEYANFDPTYSLTGVLPSLVRLEQMLEMLVRLQPDSQRLSTFVCLGYFEDIKHSRYGLVYELPNFVYSGPSDTHKQLSDLKPVTLRSLLQTTSNKIVGLTPPPLEDRFRLAFRLAQTFSRLHEDNFVHKDLNSGNVLLFKKSKPAGHASGIGASEYALRYPRVCSFDLFTEFAIEGPTPASSFNIYRHPSDPRTMGDFTSSYGLQYDLYSLGLILLEIGLWLPLGDLFKSKYSLAQFKSRLEDMWIRKLAAKCGTAYMQVVRDCFTAVDKVAIGAETPDTLHQVYTRILIRLQRCCLLDEDESPNEFESTVPTRSVATVAQPQPSQPSAKPKLRKRALAEASDSKLSFPENIVKKLSAERDTQLYEARRQSKVASPTTTGTFFKSPPSQAIFPSQLFTTSLHDISASTTLVADDPDAWNTQRAYVRSPSKDSISEISSLYKERVATAANIIQRAWRSTKDDKPSLKDFKRKVTLIQSLWRHRKAVQASQSLSDTLIPSVEASYPTPEPDVQMDKQVDVMEQSGLQIQVHQKTPKPKLWVHPAKFPPSLTDQWHLTMLPRLERIIERALRDSQETVSIDLVAIGETAATAKPTIFVTCTSVARVKAVLARKFTYDHATFDLKVRKGKVRRSKLAKKHKYRAPHRSMANGDAPDLNPCYQQRPLCGASIGAYIDDDHLPPVSFGGVVMVDGEPFGMSVHHLLDPPSDDESEYGDHQPPSPEDITRSSARRSNPWLAGMGSQPSLQLPEVLSPFEISDSEESDDDAGYESQDFDLSDDEDTTSEKDSTASTVGDIDGVEPGEGDEIYITQPAFDDVEEGFFPCEEDAPEEHLDSHTLGHVHASSGIRRWTRNGICHEIDWALLKLKDERIQPFNLVQGGKRFNTDTDTTPNFCPRLLEPIARKVFSSEDDEYPNQVAAADSLGNLSVHCVGRTSGLKGGVVGPAMSSVRIYRRRSFSRSWHVAGGFGVGGDSGAWVIDNERGRVCGHVLAWCEKNRIAYICPMEVLLEDMKRTLGAKHIRLPGADEDRPQVVLGVPPASASAIATASADVGALTLQTGALRLSHAGIKPKAPRRDEMEMTIAAPGREGENEKLAFDLPAIREIRLGGEADEVPPSGAHRSLGSPVGLAAGFGQSGRQMA